ncbi:unnamed protein product [Soboliphyme baturini]|uniref:Mcl1_mid domain-containing protein n=1 Tax=Soboliphyme baturini TaxID=241478 RepID=A0A183IFD2_9BILA|nr:unnamed protein product [Soboliphyme baturini]
MDRLFESQGSNLTTPLFTQYSWKGDDRHCQLITTDGSVPFASSLSANAYVGWSRTDKCVVVTAGNLCAALVVGASSTKHRLVFGQGQPRPSAMFDSTQGVLDLYS